MKSLLLIIMCFISTCTFSQKQFETQGVVVPRTIEFQKRELQLNGFGTRSKMWIDVYVQALFLTNLSQDAKYILDGDTEMAIRIQIISNLVTSKKLIKALNKGMLKAVGEEKTREFQSQLNKLEGFLGAEVTTKGDAFNLVYYPFEKSIWVFKNDILLGKLPGFEFKKAFFGIWLSDNPVDSDLKNDLLGK